MRRTKNGVAAGMARACNGDVTGTGSSRTKARMERCCPRGRGDGERARLCLQDDQAGVEMLVLQVHVGRMCKRLSSFLEHDNELEETQMGALAERRWDGELAATRMGMGETATCKQLGASIQTGKEVGLVLMDKQPFLEVVSFYHAAHMP